MSKYAETDELEGPSITVRDYIGEVSVVDDAAGVCRLVRMSNGAGHKSGAQELSHGSLSIRARFKYASS